MDDSDDDFWWSAFMNWGQRFMHMKRGSTYVKIGTASLQAGSPVVEGVALTIYRCEKTGRLWARPESEFNDGRFEEIYEN